MKSRPDDNPYSSPTTFDPQPATTSRITPRHAILFKSLRVLCGLSIAFCFFWFSAAVYEIASLQDTDYGPHTWRFRNSYLHAAGKSLLIGMVSLLALAWIQRRLRRSS
ncbi:MAG: hypothetical protein WBD31_28295 [Rubripirellula sp.]